MGNKVLRMIVTYFLAFAAAVLAAVAVIAIVVGVALSKPCVNAVIKNTGYEDKAEKEIVSALETYAIPGGLPDGFFASGLEREELHKNIVLAVDCAYSGKEFTVSGFPQTLTEKIMKYASENDIKSSVEEDGLEESIEGLVNHCTESYKQFTYSTPLKYIGAVGSKLSPWLLIGAVLSVVFAVFICEVLCRMGDKKFIRHALNGAAIMLISAPLAILLSGSVARLGLTSACLFSLITGLLYFVLSVPIITGILILILANIKLSSKRG